MENIIQNDKMQYSLVITEAIWSKDKDTCYNVREEKINIDEAVSLSSILDEKITLKVKEEIKDSVCFEISKSMSIRDYENDEINLSNKETNFMIKKGGQVILDTLSMDIGASYKIELK